MILVRLLKQLLPLAVVAALVAAGYFSRDAWLPWIIPAKAAAGESSLQPPAPADRVVLSDQAIANLGLKAVPLEPTTYWKSITVPGMVIDRPGQSDRGVVSPIMGVIQAVHHFPGESVSPGEPLFTLRLLSETLHQTQSELYKTSQSIKLALTQKQRLVDAGNAIPEVRLIEMDQQLARLDVAARALRAELGTRGFSTEQIDGVAEGKYVRDIDILVPPQAATSNLRGSNRDTSAPIYEIQELKAELGHQVQAGQTLCTLSNHRILDIEGRAFRDETPFLERAAKENWNIVVDFQEADGTGWPKSNQTFRITSLANTIDPVNRTFAFRMPLENESKVIQHGASTQTLWRYRPGQKVRLHIPIEKLENVFVLPRDGVALDGFEPVIFTQNVNTFLKKPVRVLFKDRTSIVVANDGNLAAGLYVVHSAATQLVRMVKAAQSSGAPPGYHMHADGSIHKNGEDE